MSFRFILFYCFLCCISLYGQSGSMSLDSQEVIIKNYISIGENDSAKIFIDRLRLDAQSSNETYWVAISDYHEGRIYKNQLNYILAVETLLRAREKFQEADSILMALLANNQIFLIYSEEDLEISLQYIDYALNLAEKIDDQFKLGKWYNTLGNTHLQLGNLELAMEAELKSKYIFLELNSVEEISYCHSTIGEIFFMMNQLDSSEFYLQKSLQIKLENKMNTGWLKSKFGKLRLAQNRPKEALKMCTEGYNEMMIERQPEKRAIIFNCECMYESFAALADYKNAYIWILKYLELKSETESDDKKDDLTRLNYQMQYEQKATADSVAFVKEKEITAATIEFQKERIAYEASIRIYLFIGLGIVLLFSFFLINRFQVIKRQKAVIAKKKEEADRLTIESEHHRLIAEEKNSELIDSITYAKRIQNAILPDSAFVTKTMGESFIIYKPKDIVAGDFYWVKQEHGRIYFAAADCTGHGVPGAMVSVICNNALNRALIEFNLIEPGDILDKTRELITSELAKGENEVADGMDIALCSIENSELKYAGANNPLWIARKGEMLVTKPDKQPVGKFFKSFPFTTHSVNLEKGDTIFVFSDGYQDQFGGDKGKKFKAKALMDLLLDISVKPMKEQEDILTQEFDQWKGKFEQLDDVCVIGVRV